MSGRQTENGIMHNVPASNFRAMAAWPRALLDRVFPPVCLACDAPISDNQHLCGPCWAQLSPITRPHCPVLGLPFAMDLGPGAKSAEALAHPPAFDRARYAVRFNDKAREIVHHLKYRDRHDMARFCARMMAQAAPEFWQEPGVIVPVPLHWRRQLARRYNQSGLLATALGRETGLPVATQLVKRIRPTRQQVGLSARARAKNVRGAFAVNEPLLATRESDRIILVDDVMTTGATITALAKLLRSHYISRVDVICFARVTSQP
ncbi:ComF family protein [Maritalea mediterranea]|uniref:ComF family protein n=1 Tax=Maritalea mediterranea TaxID=2909667 RepID=A0ABS9EDN8_9HYPH|nr:ComF family protein [Maritalea mediterranea]MCF4099498.1 ComF family protein [Maritalea mediterranea]